MCAHGGIKVVKRAMRRNDGYSVSKRTDGRWMSRVMIGYKDGKPNRMCFYGKTRTEVVNAAQEFAHALKTGGFAPTTKDSSLGDWLDRWLAIYITDATHAPKTIKSYKEQIENHIKPALGHVALRKLTPQHVQRLMNDKLAPKIVEGQEIAGLSPTSVNGMHRVLRAALSQAQRERLVADNVAKLTRPPSIRTRAGEFFTAEDLAKLFTAAEGHHLENLFRFAPYVGMRLGEITGLRWVDVDFRERTVTIANQLQWVKGHPELRPPKSRASKRVLSIEESVFEYLTAQRAMILVQQFENPMGLVFVSSVGNPLDPKLVNNHLKALCRQAKIRELSFHKFRHTTATQMLGSGEESHEVMNFLGHSQIALTVNTYGGVLRESQRRASRRLTKVINEGIERANKTLREQGPTPS